jgi:hypothetical protein
MANMCGTPKRRVCHVGGAGFGEGVGFGEGTGFGEGAETGEGTVLPPTAGDGALTPELLGLEELELLGAPLDLVPELEAETAAVLGGELTWMEKAGSTAEALPSLAVIMIFA